VGSKNTDREFEDILTAGPACIRKLFQPESWSPEDSTNLWWWLLASSSRNQRKLEKLLQAYPPALREYRKRCKEVAIRNLVPPSRPGRPRKDALANEAIDLKSTGRSYGQIAQILNLKHGTGTTTREAVIQLIKRKRETNPNKS
jgi:hypothetical protein